jgi:histidinol-phosphate aminotransferase
MTRLPRALTHIAELAPYQPGLPIAAVARRYGLDPAAIVKLASNENPLGMSPKARQALTAALSDQHRYPEQHDLQQALAARHSLVPDNVILGNGSCDLLDVIARTFLGPGDEAISSQYGFAIYRIATQAAGARNVVVPAAAYGHDLDAIRQAITPATNVIWIANPNNPTGTFVPYSQVKEFLERVPPRVLVVLDEAYYEYLSPELRADSSTWLAGYPNLVLIRTFSKVYGLAGLRVGYAMGSAEIVEILNRARQPFNVSTAAIAAAGAALEDDAFVAKSYRHNRRAVRQLRQGLQASGLEILPAYGNFVTFKSLQAAQLNEFLLQQGVIVRPLNGYGMPDWLRVTAGTVHENNRFLATLTEWYSKNL